jgi:hypothetical protein
VTSCCSSRNAAVEPARAASSRRALRRASAR